MTNPIIYPYYNSKGKRDTSQTGLPVYALDITDKFGFPILVVKDKQNKWWALDTKTNKFTQQMSHLHNPSIGKFWNFKQPVSSSDTQSKTQSEKQDVQSTQGAQNNQKKTNEKFL